MLNYFIRQFGNPTGPVGAIAGFIMATRPSNRARNECAVSLLQLEGSGHVLEIGCGPGLALEAMCRAMPAAHVTGIDHSALMVARARKRLARQIAAGRADVREADAADLPFRAAQFDRILAVNSFAFWRAVPGAIETVLTLVKPGGRLVIVHQPRGRNTTDEACRQFAGVTTGLLSQAGFVNVRTQYLPLSPIVAGIVAER